MLRTTVVFALVAAGFSVPASAQLKTPTDWKWALDKPARLITAGDVADTTWQFVAMPPGWHVATGPGAIVYHPSYEGRGRFSLESETFLFPGESPSEMGLFVGGRVSPAAQASYTAFVIRRDGSAAVMAVRDGTLSWLVPWARHDSIAPQTGTDAVRNVLRVDVDSAEVVFRVNGAEVSRVSGTLVPREGSVGFRVGPKVNLHASTLEVIYHLAAPRRRQ